MEVDNLLASSGAMMIDAFRARLRNEHFMSLRNNSTEKVEAEVISLMSNPDTASVSPEARALAGVDLERSRVKFEEEARDRFDRDDDNARKLIAESDEYEAERKEQFENMAVIKENKRHLMIKGGYQNNGSYLEFEMKKALNDLKI